MVPCQVVVRRQTGSILPRRRAQLNLPGFEVAPALENMEPPQDTGRFMLVQNF